MKSNKNAPTDAGTPIVGAHRLNQVQFTTGGKNVK